VELGVLDNNFVTSKLSLKLCLTGWTQPDGSGTALEGDVGAQPNGGGTSVEGAEELPINAISRII
jgi:hypothetical protein